MWFGLLGPLLVRLDDRDLHLNAARQRVLLAALLLTPRHLVSAGHLAELVWDGQPPRGSAVTLRSYVMRLRRALGPVAGARIVTSGRGYLIEATEEEVDIARYSALCGLGEAALRNGAWQQAADLLKQAQLLWRGTPLADIPCDELAVTEVPRLEELRLQGVQWRIEADLHLDRSAQCVPELHALIAKHPLREPFHYQLMAALYLCGRRADALAAYQHARGVLVSEIGIEPGSDLQLLQQRILADEELPTAHQQSEQPGQPAQVIAVASAQISPPPRQLPPPVLNFVGRSAELSALTDLLDAPARANGATMIAVITGAAGIGKSALAVRWAHQVAKSFPDGQLYVNLNGFGPAGAPVTQADAVSRLLEALQVPQARIPASLDGQIGLYRTLLSERRALIVLDNAKDADQVRPLLPSGGGCLVLVTSRSPLTGLVAIEGARTFELSVLMQDEARQMVIQRLGPRRSVADRLAADQLIDACARLPLALAIAAALVAARPGQSLREVARDLGNAYDRLDVLSTGDATSNLRAVFRWSYQALTPQAARMFRLLAEHPGPDISAAAAASLCGVPAAKASAALIELADLHLIESRGDGRYALHDLLRLYAAEMLTEAESRAERLAAGRRLLDHYLHSAHTAARAISPARDLLKLNLEPPAAGVEPEDLSGSDQAIAWLKVEQHALMRAIGYAAQGEFDTRTWQLARALTDFLELGGHWSDFAASQRMALAAAQPLQVRAEYLTEMRKKAGLTQDEVAEAMGVTQQRVSAIEGGSVAELATLADYIRTLGGELKVIADFGGSWRRVT